MNVVVVGAGVFGLTAALELRARGYSVIVIDPGPVPTPDAASTDITKCLRADYGDDALYCDLMTRAFEGWDNWNELWNEPVYHQTGATFLSTEPMAPGGFEHDSYALLRARGYPLERLDAAAIARRFPAWADSGFVDGYLNPRSGWAASARIIAQLAEQAIARGVMLREHLTVTGLLERGGRVVGVVAGGAHIEGDAVLVAAGARTHELVGDLRDRMWASGHDVLLFCPDQTELFRPPAFITWTADIARAGWYGFPALADGTLKIAHHGVGRRLEPGAPRTPSDGVEGAFRTFLRERLPAAARAPVVGGRLCVYCDTFDGDFFIDRHPDRPGLAVAAGGSGHAFKFAPVLGALTANAIEGRPHPRFAWRDLGPYSTEAARSDTLCR